MRIAPRVVLSAEDREHLERLARGRKTAARVVERARIVLLAAEDKQNQEIAKILGVTRRTVGVWRGRFVDQGIDGILKDAPRAGRRRRISDEMVREIVRKTTQETPVATTHWSTRSLAKVMGLSPSTIGRIWRSHGLKPHLTRTFKLCQRSPKIPPSRSPKTPPSSGLLLSCLIPRRRACGTCGRRRCLAPSKELWETPLLAFSIAPAGSIGHSFLFRGAQGPVGDCSGGAAGPSGAVYGSLRVSSPALRFSLRR